MKILLVSDTHGRTEELGRLLEAYRGEVGMVCHMGDYGRDLMRFEKANQSLKMVAVNGNSDFSPIGHTEQIVEVIAKNGKALRLLVTHGHRFGVKRGFAKLLGYAKEMDLDAVFFGHTHEEVCFNEDGVFAVNPGSLAYGRRRERTYAIVTVTDDGGFEGELLEYDF